MTIRRLTDNIVNQIAAGEVVEWPASVVRELLDNAIDSGATQITVATSGGGKNLIRVTDNGCGMSRDDLERCIERHCTSKLSNNLNDIRTLGFRGEALPSIGSVARLGISSRTSEEPNGWEVRVNGGAVQPVRPTALNQGTVVEVCDLFYATPARLKFLKTDRAEANAISDVIKRTVLAHPEIHIAASGDDRQSVSYPVIRDKNALLQRCEQVLGGEFAENALPIDARREGVTLTGYASLPTFNRGNAQHQFVYVNGRPVRDKQLTGAIRGAYMDFLSRHRHPVLVLFLSIDPAQIDVNVHPAKAEVRFRDSGLVRGLLVGALREAITQAGHRASTDNADNMLNAFRPGGIAARAQQGAQFRKDQPNHSQTNYTWQESPNRPVSDLRSDTLEHGGFSETGQAQFAASNTLSADMRASTTDEGIGQQLPLGAARAQIHANYIVAQTDDGLVIVDQHAAHERLVYEKMKQQIADSGVRGQLLLIPEIVELPEVEVNRLLDHGDELKSLGLTIEGFGPGAIAVRETPALLGEVNCADLLKDLVDEISQWGSASLVKQKMDHVAATIACHGSVRSGRKLLPAEMNQLLRDMESTPNSGQCNHGRPTYVELKLSDIEKLFGRR